MRHKDFLKSQIECTYGLLNNLFARLTLSDHIIANISGFGTKYKQAEKLLEIMSRRKSAMHHEQFLSSLEQTTQSHLASFIIKDGSRLNLLCKLILNSYY